MNKLILSTLLLLVFGYGGAVSASPEPEIVRMKSLDGNAYRIIETKSNRVFIAPRKEGIEYGVYCSGKLSIVILRSKEGIHDKIFLIDDNAKISHQFIFENGQLRQKLK